MVHDIIYCLVELLTWVTQDRPIHSYLAREFHFPFFPFVFTCHLDGELGPWHLEHSDGKTLGHQFTSAVIRKSY